MCENLNETIKETDEEKSTNTGTRPRSILSPALKRIAMFGIVAEAMYHTAPYGYQKKKATRSPTTSSIKMKKKNKAAAKSRKRNKKRGK